MLSQTEKQNILSEFPNIKLSYENITHKKVFNADYIVAIPEGKKCFVWFTSLNDKNVCLIMELTSNKQISDIKIVNSCFSNELAYGTILYGTFFYSCSNKFFSIEDIFRYKGDDIDKMSWGDKLKKIAEMMKNDLKQISYNNYFIVFGIPLISKSNEELERKIEKIDYKIDSIQFNLFNRVNNYLFMDYKIYIQTKSNKYEKAVVHEEKTLVKNNVKNQLKREIVFNIRADIQDDIYHLFYINDELNEEEHSIACIPDYNTSVMMNKLFRIIKENDNLDALEESDDEEEFENDNIDKFVHLDKSYKMICQFNHKFKKWNPIKIADENSEIIKKYEIKNIYKIYEQNKKK
jgi:hypothetical protein